MTGEPTTAKSLIYIGNFVSRHLGTKPYCEMLSAKLEELGWRVVRASSDRSRLRRWFSMLSAASRAAPGVPVVVDVFSTAAFLWAETCTRMATSRGAPVVLILRGGAMPLRAATSGRRMKALFSRATRIVTPSRYLCDKLRELAPTGIEYLPNAIDISSYHFRETTKALPRMVWLRALAKDYLPEVAVRVLGELQETVPDAMLLIAGPDKQDGTARRIQRVAEDLDIRQSIELVGSIPKAEVPAFLQRGDIFLNTTRYESFGVSVMEAAACGLCVVTSNAGELPYLWEDGQDAFVVPVGDVGATVSAIRALIDEPLLARRLSNGGRRKAESHDWISVLPLWNDLLDEVACGE